MSQFQTIASVLAAIVLFIHGLDGFTHELQRLGADAVRRVVAVATRTRYRGFFVGALVTALLQSSSAVSSLTVALVESGALTFRNSLAVLLGANVGTTTTAWLVSFKLTGIGAYFIVLGAAATLGPRRLTVLGRATFYFGFVLFALDLMSASLLPFRDSPALVAMLGASASIPLAVAAGAVATALVQSSSVTSGLVIVLTQQEAVAPEAAIAAVVGANVGTTVTAMVAALRMGSPARRAARANLMFNFAGVLLLLPWLPRFARTVLGWADDPAMAVALAHLLFNVGIAGLFLVALRPFERLLLRMWPADPHEAAQPEEPV